jgi:hypothetical protein
MKMWNFRGHSVTALGLLGTAFIFASLASATTLAPDGSVSPVVVDAAGVSGTLLASVTDPYNVGLGGNQDIGSVTEWVVSDANNTFGAGDLDFIYQVTIDGAGDASKLTVSNYASLTTDVYDALGTACAACAGDVAGTVSASTASNNGVGGISFNFLPVVPKNTTSYLLIVETGATQWVPGQISVIDNTTANLGGFAPAPEPGSVGLLLGGLFSLGLFVRRFRTQQS